MPHVVVLPSRQPELSHGRVHQGEPRLPLLPRLQVTLVPTPSLVLNKK